MTISYFDDDLLTDKELAKYLKVNPGTPAVWRAEKRHAIPYIKIGKSVRHRFGDVKKWLREREMSGDIATERPHPMDPGA